MAYPTPADEHSGAPEAGLHPRFTCRFCGQTHCAVALKSRQRAQCVRCGLTLAKGSRFGADTTAALVTAALILTIPALTLPFVTVGKLGSEHVGYLFSGARALWSENMQLLSLWVSLCAGLLPVVLLGLLAALTLPERFLKSAPWTTHLRRLAVAVAPWAMPEVYLLGVLVALTKLGSLVDVKIGPGFWCYAAMSVLVLLAWRNFHLGSETQESSRA
ncbi:paraquat-inducible protein A [Nibricoccus aquaticus]|nr:paraquat-inducible protein A [Nibricoccus aquaticus]